MSWIFYALASAFTASLTTIFAKVGLKNLDSTIATTLRSIIMSLFLIIFVLSTKKINLIQENILSIKNLWAIILSGLAGASSWLLYFIALDKAPAFEVAAIDKLSLVFVAVLALIFLGENLTALNAIGILLIMIGTFAATY